MRHCRILEPAGLELPHSPKIGEKLPLQFKNALHRIGEERIIHVADSGDGFEQFNLELGVPQLDRRFHGRHAHGSEQSDVTLMELCGLKISRL